MKAEERDEIVQSYIRIRESVKTINREFIALVESIDDYKTVLINIQIEKLEEKKKKRFWER